MKSLLWKRTLCCLLSMILILGNLPVFSFAEESDGLCEHHTFHTSECGYSPAIPGSPCTHEHTQDCYQTVAECIHVHDDACGYNEEVGDASCAHVCSEEYGCFKLVPDCRHAHDESCGYVEAVLEQPCTYSCTECAEPGKDPSAPVEEPSEPSEEPSEPEVDEAVEAVRALIEALPTLEEIKAMSTQEQSEVYTQVQKAYDAYDALTDDQKAQLPEAEEIFTSLFEYFNSLTAPAADVLLSGSCGANLTYTLDDNGTLTISGTGAMNSYPDAYSTPWRSNLSDIARIVIEDGITSIGDYAFGVVTYPNVSSVTVPQSVTKLGLYAFGGNNIQIHYPGTMEQWLSLDFYFRADTWAAPGAVCSDGTILTLGFCGEYGVSGSPRYVLTGDGCMRIYGTGDMQFNKNLTNRSHWSSYNSSITSVVVEDGVTSIADYSFDGCKNLTTVTLPDNLRSIGTYAFRSCTALKAIDIPSSVTNLGSGVFQSSGLESIEIPEGVKYIKDYSFLNCSALSSVTIPSSVTNIGGQAFYGCSVLTDIYYGSDEQAWNQITIAANNDSLSSATIHYTNPCAEGHTEETIPGKAATCTEDGLTDGKKCSVCGKILEEQQVIPAGHNFVDGVCSGCGAITGSCGAEGDNLTYLLTTDGVLTISGSGDMKDYYDFHSTPWYNQRTKITSLVVMDGVNSIGYDTFEDCTNLISVLLPDSVSRIEYAAFNNCSKLNTITIPEGLAALGDYAFSGCSSLTAVTVPEKITSIGQSVFSGCSSLKSITIPKGVSSIGDYAFSGCSSLETIIIPEKVISIGEGAFNECTSLSSITLSQGLISIGDYAFFHCESLTSIDIPEGVTSIHDSVFGWCKNLTTVTIPKGVKYIGEDVFACCDSLETVHFLGNGICGNNSVFWTNVVAYYPRGNTTWTQEIRDSYGSRVTWVEEGAERLLELAGTGLENEQVVWIDGVAVPVQKDGSGNSYVTLPENSSSILVTYSFNTGSGDRHTQYPTGMKVYRVEKTDSGLTVAHLPELDNLLQYSGCSIRIVGVKGIRMITSISKSTRSALMGDGLAGYKLVEYGTALCRASALEGGAPMALGTPGVKSNYAYKRGVADPIFKDTGSLIQYTNVLVGFTDEDCKEDIAMRPYIILEDEKGETVTLYGGTVYRSIGYIAYQNRNAFAPGSNAYNYVWDIIHYVYEDQYDADYKG